MRLHEVHVEMYRTWEKLSGKSSLPKQTLISSTVSELLVSSLLEMQLDGKKVVSPPPPFSSNAEHSSSSNLSAAINNN